VVTARPRLVVVVAGGPPAADPPPLPAPDLVIAADSGLHHALALGLRVDVLVGDLDSVDPTLVGQAGRVERHPVDKDATDLELALDLAMRHEPERVFVVASAGGRLDHALAGLLLLANPAYAGTILDAVIDRTLVHVLHGPRTLVATPGELLTLVAVGGPVRVERTSGLRWPLRDEILHPASSRGVSNEVTAGSVELDIAGGALLAIRPAGHPA
jgi:thiamine pyrophosphokinase